MTDDLLPLEYSWSWDAGSHPRIRYSVEVISPDAETVFDSFNQVQTMRVVDQLCGALPETNRQ